MRIRYTITLDSEYKEMKQFERDSKYLHENYDSLLEKHPNKWIAIYKEKVVCSNETLKNVLEEVDNKKIKRCGLVVEFMDPNPSVWILPAN